MDAAFASNDNGVVGETEPRPSDRESRAAVILGNDAVVAARPASPFQLANACRAAGFDIVVPPSWGDELVAGAYLDRLAGCHDAVAVACNCDRVRRMLVLTATDARQRDIEVAAPSVAAARYLRLTYGGSILVTYVGDCPSADDPTIDARFSPAGFFASLERQGISLGAQADTMPDGEAERWHRHRSLPGGLPARRWLARPPVDRVLREVDREGVDAYRSSPPPRSNVLLDLTEASSCACGGNRAIIEDEEGPRSMSPIVVAPPDLDLTGAPSETRAGTMASSPRPRTAPDDVKRVLESRSARAEEAAVAVVAETRGDAAEESPISIAGETPLTSVSPLLDATPGLEPTTTVLEEENGDVEQSAAEIDAAPLASALVSADPVPLTISAIAATPAGPPRPSPVTLTPRAEARRAAQAASDRRRRTIALVVVPALVVVAAGALGAAAYTAVSRGRGRAPTVTAERSSPNVIDARFDSIVAGGSVSTPDSAAASAPEDTIKRADSTPVDTAAAKSDSLRKAALRRQPSAPEIVPGWLPQGDKSWTPNDSMRTPKPDSTKPVRSKPDTIPPA